MLRLRDQTVGQIWGCRPPCVCARAPALGQLRPDDTDRSQCLSAVHLALVSVAGEPSEPVSYRLFQVMPSGRNYLAEHQRGRLLFVTTAT